MAGTLQNGTQQAEVWASVGVHAVVQCAKENGVAGREGLSPDSFPSLYFQELEDYFTQFITFFVVKRSLAATREAVPRIRVPGNERIKCLPWCFGMQAGLLVIHILYVHSNAVPIFTTWPNQT